MIDDPALNHRFVMLFDIKNASPQSLEAIDDPMSLTQDVRYGLVKDGTLRQQLNTHLHRQFGLPMLKKEQSLVLNANPKAKKALCKRYYNVRMFGVAGQEGQPFIPGPVRFSWAKSLDPILPVVSGQNAAYGLYRLHGSYNPAHGWQTGVKKHDLDLFWEGLHHLLYPNPSLHPMTSSIRGLWIFSHRESDVPAKELFGLIQTPSLHARAQKFEDYIIRFPQPGNLEAHNSINLTYLA